ncbi:beta-Ala-His dipeptidase [Peptoniphilus phoceensis]|uniref:beta-Ala-His dipeptidase n=1 Tax=Peptoniphilus phoceensis TaxID=1720298 RepID=UPI0007864BD2|nr:beta-Ala-His dipeptidase [Peptoniphilus phoceensis]
MNLEAKKVFDYFEKLSQIPRESGNEKEVSDFLKKFGEEKGYDVVQDESLNIIMEVPATKGMEDRPKVILQGHMDMVCEKGKDSKHNFETDPIELLTEGDSLHANDTTLGADDGIGVAMSLALAEEEHGPLKIIVTVSEETDMHGAKDLDAKYLEGKYLINIDSEEEGILTVSSAGGKLLKSKFKFQEEDYSGDAFKLNLHGFLGGHSGMEIANNRGNMIKVIAEILNKVDNAKLIDIDCGTKQNAIPREGKVSLVADEKSLDDAIKFVKEKFKDVAGELTIECEKTSHQGRVLTAESTEKLAKYLLELPTGPHTFINEEKKVLESSSNLAIAKKVNDAIEVFVSLRFASSSLSEEFGNIYLDIVKNYGAEAEFINPYPEWEYREESDFRELVERIYKELSGSSMEEEFTHGGLECGVFFTKNRELDIVSIGPDITGAHSQKETLSISSTNRVYEHLKKVLKEIK